VFQEDGQWSGSETLIELNTKKQKKEEKIKEDERQQELEKLKKHQKSFNAI